jgi:type IV secretion system protein VirB4
MFDLREYRKHPDSLADFLPWAALVAPGVVLNKDGSLQRAARFRGPDLDSATPAELVATTARLNNALRRLGSGWAIFVEAQRNPATGYPESRFPDPVSALVDAERKAEFEEEGAHFESGYYLTFVFLPPAEEAARAESLLFEGRQGRERADWHEVLKGFVDRTDRVLQLVEGFVPDAEWLDDAETLTYLHSTVSTRRQRVRVPEAPMHLDAVLVDETLTGGLEPRLGSTHLRTLTVHGFPHSTFPGILDDAVWRQPPPRMHMKIHGHQLEDALIVFDAPLERRPTFVRGKRHRCDRSARVADWNREATSDPELRSLLEKVILRF